MHKIKVRKTLEREIAVWNPMLFMPPHLNYLWLVLNATVLQVVTQNFLYSSLTLKDVRSL